MHWSTATLLTVVEQTDNGNNKASAMSACIATQAHTCISMCAWHGMCLSWTMNVFLLNNVHDMTMNACFHECDIVQLGANCAMPPLVAMSNGKVLACSPGREWLQPLGAPARIWGPTKWFEWPKPPGAPARTSHDQVQLPRAPAHTLRGRLKES